MKRRSSRMLLVGTLAVAGLVGVAAPAAAQDDNRASVSVGAAFLKWIDFTAFVSKGVAFDVVKPGIFGGMPEWAVVGDVGIYHEGDEPETDSSFLGGVRYGKRFGQCQVFGQGLVGGVHWVIPDGGSNTGFAFVPGGGVIVMINDRIGIKGQVDYFVMKWNDGVDDGDLFRFWAGVDIKLGKKK